MGVEVLDRVVPALERERPAGPLAAHNLELLLEHGHALPQRWEREAERLVLGLAPAGAHSDLDPAA
jgi:hypothetical protein